MSTQPTFDIARMRGMSLPFQRTGGSDFTTAEGEALVKANLMFLLTTPIGFLPWRPDFGSRLHELRHSPDTITLRETVRVIISDAITKWLPYVRLDSVDVESKRQTKSLQIKIAYRIVRNGVATGPTISQAVTINTV